MEGATLSLAPLVPWLSLLAAALSVGTILWNMLNSGSKRNAERLESHAKRLGDHDQRLASLEQAQNSMPTKDDIHALHLGMAEMRGDPESGAGIVLALKFTEEWYRLNMPPLKTAFEDDALAIIKDAEHVGDLRMIKLIRGIPRVPPVREGETGKKRHGDYGIALALAHWASRLRWVEYDYQAVPPRQPHTPGRLSLLPEADDEDDFGRDPFSGPLGARIRGGI